MRRASLTAAALAALLLAAPASAATTRVEYVAQVDPICQQANRDSRQASRGLEPPDASEFLSPKDQIRAFTHWYAKVTGRGNKVIGRANALIAAVPPAPGDEMIVGLWIQALQDYKRISDRAVHAGRHSKTKRMFALLGRAGSVGAQASRLVSEFGFRHCA